MPDLDLDAIEAEHHMSFEPIYGDERCGCGMAYGDTDGQHPCYVPALVAEVRRLRAALQEAADNELRGEGVVVTRRKRPGCWACSKGWCQLHNPYPGPR